MQHRVLLVEDQQATLDRLAKVVQDHPRLKLLAAVDTLAAANQFLDNVIPDVLLTDLDLPDGNGIELIRRLESTPETLSMVVTMFGDEEHVVNAIRAGATGYLLKDGPAQDIGDAIMDMLDGGAPISPGIARFLLKRLKTVNDDNRTKQPVDGIELPKLTKREKEVLLPVAKGFSYAEIADMLNVSVHTVTFHIRNIYRKLAVGSRGEAVYEAMQMGILSSES